MKFIASIFLVFLTFASYSQVTKAISANPKKEVLFFLDSVRVGKNQVYFDFNKLAGMNVAKDTDATSQIDGRIYMKSKNPKDYKFLTLKGIEKTYAKSVSGSTLFMIDNVILKDDISTYKIDSAYILNVEVLKSTEIEHLKNMRPLLTIINIKLRTKGNVDKMNEANGMHIRGEDYSLLNNLYNRNE
jgi:hypothetical protein